MRDGRIVARTVRAYFDSGAYTRLSSYAVVKCAAHIPGPYTIPNVSADVYCVFTNRTPATAMRGFGVTALDFALECSDGQGRHGHRHGPARIPHSQRLPRRRHESASPRGEELRADRMRAGRGREGQLAAARRVPQNVVAARRRRSAHRRRGRSHARAGAGSPDTRTGRHAAARILRTADAGCSAPIHNAACAAAAQCPAAPRVTCRIDAWCAALFFSLRHQEALTMAKHRGRGVATINYPIGMNWRRSEPGAGSFQSDRQVHGRPLLHRPRTGNEIGDAANLRRDAGRAGRGRLCRHCRFRYRPALHGLVRIARHASCRQRGDGGSARSARSDDGSSRRRARSRSGRPRDRRQRLDPRQGRAAPIHLGARCRHRGAIPSGQDHLRARHFSGAAVGRRSGNRRDVAGHLLRPCLPDRRSRSGRRNRRCCRAEDDQFLRDRARAEPEARRATARRRRLDGHEPCSVRDA